MFTKLRHRFYDALEGFGFAAALPILGIAFMLATKTNAGLDLEWNEAIGKQAGAKGTATASSATSLTDSGASWGTTQYIGFMVVAQPASGGLVYANILSHTATVLTVDRWYDATSPGGTAGTTPSATGQYVIVPAAPPSQFIGLTANASAVASGDTTLPGEITTAGGGLIRKQATLSHSAGGATGTVVGVFTANGSDSLPVTIAKMGVGPSLLSTANQLFQTLLSATATITTSGDQVTVTDTVTG